MGDAEAGERDQQHRAAPEAVGEAAGQRPAHELHDGIERGQQAQDMRGRDDVAAGEVLDQLREDRQDQADAEHVEDQRDDDEDQAGRAGSHRYPWRERRGSLWSRKAE